MIQTIQAREWLYLMRMCARQGSNAAAVGILWAGRVRRVAQRESGVLSFGAFGN